MKRSEVAVFIIGLTGGIASGKSTASAILGRMGACIIDADRIARGVASPGQEAFTEIVEAFGARILNEEGTINRKALAQRVFNDPQQLERLNRITHPRIIAAIGQELEHCRRNFDIAVVDAALLVELNLTAMVDEVWLVCVDSSEQLRRLQGREGMSEADALKIIGAQMPQEEKQKRVDVCIDNNGTVEFLEVQIKALWQQRILNNG